MLSRRFVTTQVPLDLTDEELDAGEQELLLHRKKLDAMGWNPTFDGLSRNRVVRAWHLMSLIRDEILELAQGPLEENLHERRQSGSQAAMTCGINQRADVTSDA